MIDEGMSELIAELIAVSVPNISHARVIAVPQTGSADPLSMDERIMLAQAEIITDLLEALQRMLRQPTEKPIRLTPEQWNELCNARMAAMAAISKATRQT